MDGGRLPLEAWFWEMPTCTRWWTTATVLTSALVQCQMVTPFQLFYSFRAVFVKSQVCLLYCSRLYPVAFLEATSRSIKIQDRGASIADAPHPVLAIVDDFPLFRSLFPRSLIPRLFSPAICKTHRRILRSFPSTIFVAASLCDDLPDCSLAFGIDTLSRPSSFFDTRIYLVPKKP